MGFYLKRSKECPGCCTVELAELGREDDRAEQYANTRCCACQKIIGLGVAFLRVDDGRLAHNDCVQGRLL